MTWQVSLRARANQRYAYSGRSLFVGNLDGAITGQGTEGFYVDNTRLLSREVLTADGKALTPVVASRVRGDSFLAYGELPPSTNIPEHAVYVEIARFLDRGMRTALKFTNYAIDRTARFTLEILRKASELKKRFDQAFWIDDVGFYALALGPDKRQIRSIASNAGHLLAPGIVPAAKAERVVRRWMEPDLFTGWGIRTLSCAHVAYNPFSYHRGSVWPVENGTFALGFARYGYWDALHRLAEGLFAASDLFEMNRLPEAIGGLPRDTAHPHPGIYPRSCAPQAWSASAVVVLVQSLLGLRPVAPFCVLLVDPHLPSWLPDVRLEGIRVGSARVDQEFRRQSDGRTTYHMLKRKGNIRVLHQPVPNGPEASLVGRARATLTSVIQS